MRFARALCSMSFAALNAQENGALFTVLASPRNPLLPRSTMARAVLTEEQVLEALSKVTDPEIGRPITELDMVKKVTIDGGNVIAEIYLTIAGCPLKDRITRDVTLALK